MTPRPLELFQKFIRFGTAIRAQQKNINNMFETVMEMDGKISVLHCGCIVANKKAAFPWFIMESVRCDIWKKN